jgi:hypothetical protein
MSKTLTAAGLLLTLVGAGVLSWRDLGGPGFAKPDYRALLGGFRRREAWPANRAWHDPAARRPLRVAGSSHARRAMRRVPRVQRGAGAGVCVVLLMGGCVVVVVVSVCALCPAAHDRMVGKHDAPSLSTERWCGHRASAFGTSTGQRDGIPSSTLENSIGG